ncbi:MAG: hypothetical protein K0R57_153 [Paenibacillaceae bacterium]|jgi:hypothetical protein|nr:hypothetical protein [Paenibacillaceae bacterium]
MTQSEYVPASRIHAPQAPIPAGKRLPFGWQAFAVLPPHENPQPVLISWEQGSPGQKQADGAAYLRITVALDVREEKRVEVALAGSRRVIGCYDIRYAHLFQPFEILLSQEDAALALQEGVELRMTAGLEPLWLFYEQERSQPSALFVPHLLFSASISEPGSMTSFLNRMLSLDSIQEFSWMGGCVLDGLWELEGIPGLASSTGLSPRGVIERQLGHFFDEAGILTYENPRSEPVDGRITGIEVTLPFAVLAKVWPDHPSLQTALAFWDEHVNAEGSIQDGDTLSAEGSYTVAYPLAVLARQRNDPRLAALAGKQLLIRRDKLIVGHDLYLRFHSRDGGAHTFRNWARAYAWYMLGLVRSLIELEGMAEGTAGAEAGELAALREEMSRIAAVAIGWQREDGLWPCFLDEPGVAPDTSGSAGIAAAIALAHRHGLPLPPDARASAERAERTLTRLLRPDGLLPGVAQSNRGGEALQRGDYRVLSQMGMGLLAQLYGALVELGTSR